jgi:hypothetical protein
VALWCVLSLFVALSALPVSVFAGAGQTAQDTLPPLGAVAIPLYVGSCPSDGALGPAVGAITLDEGERFSPGLAPGLRALRSDGSSSQGTRKRYLPVLYSLLVPGTGEIALGRYYRGATLLALEAVAWTGYAYYRNEGLDGRDRFESFADAHWSHDQWIEMHPAAEGLSNPTFEEVDSIGRTAWQGWPGYHSYAAREEQKQNYYENIGKYDWFISGWDDWDPMDKPMNTAVRDRYRALRKASNDDLDTADRFIFLSIATRVFSLVETAIMVYRQPNAQASVNQTKRYSFKARSTGLASGSVEFVCRF